MSAHKCPNSYPMLTYSWRSAPSVSRFPAFRFPGLDRLSQLAPENF
jgi:hypothetical protein